MKVTERSSTQKIKSAKWACGCCRNSILCTECKNWCYKRCSGLKRLTVVQNFHCPECKKDKVREEKRDGIALGGQIEEVQEFCYLGDVLDYEAGVERVVRV